MQRLPAGPDREGKRAGRRPAYLRSCADGWPGGTTAAFKGRGAKLKGSGGTATDYNLRYVRGGFAPLRGPAPWPRCYLLAKPANAYLIAQAQADCITQVIGRCPILRDSSQGQTAQAGCGTGAAWIRALGWHSASAGPGAPWWGFGDATGQGGNILRPAEAGQPLNVLSGGLDPGRFLPG